MLPTVGLSLERSIRQPRTALPRGLRTFAWVLGVVVAAFLVVHLSLVSVGSGIVAFGLIERVGFGVMIGYLILLAVTIDAESTEARARRGDRTGPPAQRIEIRRPRGVIAKPASTSARATGWCRAASSAGTPSTR